MTLLRFVHAADLHLDSPFTGLRAAAPENVADALYSATFDAYRNLVDLCIDEGVDALLVAGDIYDGADRSLRAQRRFVEGLQRLHEAGIGSFVCHGNHDPLDGWEARLAYPPSARRFEAEFEAVPLIEDDPGRAVVYGISYPQREVTENLALRLGPVDPGPFSIGLLHANVGGDPNHGPYAPCSLEDLASTGLDYWALGHVHTRRVLSERKPVVVYPGNPQGRHPNETGPRGAYLVEVDDARNVRLHFRPTDVVRWTRPQVDISSMETAQALLEALHELMEDAVQAAGHPVVARVALTGRGILHRSLRRPGFLADSTKDLNDAWAGRSPFAWCVGIEDRTRSPLDRRERLAGTDFVADLLRLCDQAKTEPDLLGQLRSPLGALYEHRSYRRYLQGSAPTDEELRALIDDAESIALDRLVEDDPS